MVAWVVTAAVMALATAVGVWRRGAGGGGSPLLLGLLVVRKFQTQEPLHALLTFLLIFACDDSTRLKI